MSEPSSCDVFVIFGITGDLAKVMTFRSLYRLEQRKLLDCPIVGVAVDDWGVEQLDPAGARVDRRDRRAARRRGVRPSRRAVLVRARRLRRRRDLRTRRQRRSRATEQPVFYLEIPPFLFATVVKGLSEAGLTKNARVVVEKPFGHDLESAQCARRGAPPVHRRVAAVPHRPLPREDGTRGDPLPAVREHDARAGLEPELRRERADHDGRGLRRRGPRPLLRPGRRAARRRREPPDAGRRRHGDGSARGRRPRRP